MIQLVGLLLPPLIDLINRRVKDSDARFWISAGVCFIFGLGINFITANGLAGYEGMTMLEIAESLSSSAITVFGLAQLAYKAVYEDSSLQTSIRLS